MKDLFEERIPPKARRMEDPTTHAAYQAYMGKAIAAMGMTLMYQVVTKNRDCALTLWEPPA